MANAVPGFAAVHPASAALVAAVQARTEVTESDSCPVRPDSEFLSRWAEQSAIHHPYRPWKLRVAWHRL